MSILSHPLVKFQSLLHSFANKGRQSYILAKSLCCNNSFSSDLRELVMFQYCIIFIIIQIEDIKIKDASDFFTVYKYYTWMPEFNHIGTCHYLFLSCIRANHFHQDNATSSSKLQQVSFIRAFSSFSSSVSPRPPVSNFIVCQYLVNFEMSTTRRYHYLSHWHHQIRSFSFVEQESRRMVRNL